MSKGRFEIRLDNELREEMEGFAEMTGKDLTAIVHDAVAVYKNSQKLKDDITAHQKRLAEKLAAFRDRKGQEKGTHDKIPKLLKSRRGKDDL